MEYAPVNGWVVLALPAVLVAVYVPLGMFLEHRKKRRDPAVWRQDSAYLVRKAQQRQDSARRGSP